MRHEEYLVAQQELIQDLLTITQDLLAADEVDQYMLFQQYSALVDQIKIERSVFQDEFTMKAVTKRYVTRTQCNRMEFLARFEVLYPSSKLTSYDQLSKIWSWLVKEGLVERSQLKSR